MHVALSEQAGTHTATLRHAHGLSDPVTTRSTMRAPAERSPGWPPRGAAQLPVPSCISNH
eukprot:362573-Chlamydomonas_euryale.AAC.7